MSTTARDTRVTVTIRLTKRELSFLSGMYNTHLNSVAHKILTAAEAERKKKRNDH